MSSVITEGDGALGNVPNGAPSTDHMDQDNGDEKLAGMSLTVNNDENVVINGSGVELTDPAILVVQLEIIKVRYTKEELLNLRDVPLSQKKPDFLDTNEVTPNIWDPTRWNFDRKKNENQSETNNGNRTDLPDHNRRRAGDPRERLRKENDGIVLSPQRRSFNSGCFVPVRPETSSSTTTTTTTQPQQPQQQQRTNHRSHSPLNGANNGKNDSGHIGGVREIQTTSNRRIGSGRILRDTWDFNEKPDNNSNNDNNAEYVNNYRCQQQQQQQQQRSSNNHNGISGDEHRRSFGRDFDNKDNKQRNNNNSNGRYNNHSHHNDRRRINNNDFMEEPEWFSGGPLSQNDTIELRGFDDLDKLNSKKSLSPSRNNNLTKLRSNSKDWFKKKTQAAAAAATTTTTTTTNDLIEENIKDDICIEEGPDGRSTPTLQVNVDLKKNCTRTTNKTKINGELHKNMDNEQQSFNFDDILNIPGLHGLLPNDEGAEGDNNAKSRFSQWFSSGNTALSSNSPINNGTNKNDSRRSSIQDEIIIKNLLKDINDTQITIPNHNDSDTYFAPISPAANTNNNNNNNNTKLNLMEMLQRINGNKMMSGNDLTKTQFQGRILNLVELEAKMRQTTPTSDVTTVHKSHKSDEDITAFNRLLQQVNGGQATTTTTTTNGQSTVNKQQQPMSLMEMLTHSQQQDEARRQQAAVKAAALHLCPNNDLLLQNHLQQQQQQQQNKQVEMLAKIMNSNIHLQQQQQQQQMRVSPLHDMGLQQSRELLSRPEAQAILQGMKRGDITPQHLYQQIANPALQPRHREMLVTILKVNGNNSGGGSGGNSGGNNIGGSGINQTVTTTTQSNNGGNNTNIGPSPRVLSPVPHSAAALYQQQQQQQLRISPLPPNAYCVSPIMATSPNTLTIPALHQRIPSPRELQVHTQNILQRALIKKKLEEQQENYRKKQEMQQQQQRGQSPNNQLQQGTILNNTKNLPSSPTPLAFTPTSVLRKMTADKDEVGKDGNKMVDGTLTQGRAVTGMRPLQQQQIGQWPYPIKQPGRPIVKANNFPTTQQQEQFFTQQQRLFNQQQQQRKPIINPQQQQQQQQQFGNHPPQYQNQFSQLTQQQLRAQHQQQARPSPQQQQINNFGNQQQQQQQQNNNVGSWQQFIQTPTNQNNRGINRGMTDGELSPTTNQLTRWFSPDLLERARGGELPSTAGLAQHALSLEEIERQTAPPIHN